jgi:hypothetical protein
MAKKPGKKTASGKRKAARRRMPSARRASAGIATRRRPKASVAGDALSAPIEGATTREIGGVRLDVVQAGAARVKRMIYPPGFQWSTAMKPVVGTERCMHAHVGFLARGEIHIEYADGCVVEYKAPQVVAIDPGHDGWVVGRQPVILIEFDFERDTIDRLGMPPAHRH